MSWSSDPGDQDRSWEAKWRDIEMRIDEIESTRTTPPNRAAIENAEREVLEFIVAAFHLKDALIKEGVAPRRDVEDTLKNDDALALAADLANSRKHHGLDTTAHAPKSGAEPVVVSRHADSRHDGWQVRVVVEHDGKTRNGLAVARDAVEAWRGFLRRQGAIT